MIITIRKGNDTMSNMKDAVLRVVKATRKSLWFAQHMKAIMSEDRADTIPENIALELVEALFSYSGEYLAPDQDLMKHSKTWALLVGDMSDGEVADEFMRMAEKNKPKMQAPILMTKEELEALYGIPEGEWR